MQFCQSYFITLLCVHIVPGIYNFCKLTYHRCTLLDSHKRRGGCTLEETPKFRLQTKCQNAAASIEATYHLLDIGFPLHGENRKNGQKKNPLNSLILNIQDIAKFANFSKSVLHMKFSQISEIVTGTIFSRTGIIQGNCEFGNRI